MLKEMWSVEMEATEWADDTFCGTYEECVEYCNRREIKIDGIEARLARFLDDNGTVAEVLEIVEEI